MNPREPSRTPSRVCPSPRLLALLLLPVLVPDEAGAAPRPRPSAGVALRFIPEPPIAYLRHIDPVPLRFHPKALPPAPWPEIAATAEPAGLAEPGSEPAAPESSAPVDEGIQPTTTVATRVSVQEPPEPIANVAGERTPPSPDSPSSVEDPARPPSPILVDELRPTVRPEDFLPFFILPGARPGESGAALIVPVPHQPPSPAAQPPSSARFIQTP